MTTRVLRFAGTRYRLPGLSAASSLLLLLVASAAFAGPPGITLSNLELAASANVERSSQIETVEGGHALMQAVTDVLTGTTDSGAELGSAPARGDAHAGDGGKERRKSLEDLVVDFLEKL